MKIFRTLIELILSHKHNTSCGITFISGTKEDKFLSYSALFSKALSRLWHLQRCGLKQRDLLILQIEDNEQFLITFWAALLGGIIPVPVTVGIDDELKQKVLNIRHVCKSSWLITCLDTFSRLKEYVEKKNPGNKPEELSKNTLLLNDFQPNEYTGEIACVNHADPAFIQFSSGSTSNPKGIILSHENIIENTNSIVKNSKIGKEDSTSNWMPLTHDMGIIGFHFTSINAGIQQYIMPPLLFGRNPLLWLQKAADYKITLLGISNFGIKHLITYFDAGKIKHLDLSCVRLIIIGAEPISPSLCRQFREILGKYGLEENTLFPVYGLAEATVAVTFPEPRAKMRSHSIDRKTLKTGKPVINTREEDPDSIHFVELGSPIQNCRVRICDLHDKELDENILGEIQVKGRNITTGYLNDHQTTQELFTNDGWLKTGDLGFMVNGKLTVSGRIKDILFCNGRNFFPYDIERVVEELSLVKAGKSAAAGVFDKNIGEEITLLFIVYKKEKGDKFAGLTREIKRSLYKRMGLTIKYVIPVKHIPRTTSGKKQRYRLRESYLNGEFNAFIQGLEEEENREPGRQTGSSEAAPEIESKLNKLWQETFRKKIINPEEDFFSLGGDSLKASYLVSRIHKDFHIEFDIEKLFHFSTITKIREYIAGTREITTTMITKVEERDFYPLSPAQKRMYILNRLNSKTTVYNIPLAIRIFDKFDKNKIEDIFLKLIEQHESLRTGFCLTGNEPVQYIKKEISFSLTAVSRLEYYAEEKVTEIIDNFITPFNIDHALPLFRAGIILYNADEFILVMDLHHIIADGYSIMLLVNDFLKLYNKESLPQPAIQYKDYSEWYYKTVLVNHKLKIQKQFWLDMFKEGIPVLNLPTDLERPQEKSFNGSTIHFNLEPMLSDQLKKFTAEHKVTLYTFILAVYYILLYKYSGQHDIVVGCPVSGRNYADISHIIGLFTNTLCIRNFPEDDKTFTSFLLEVKAQTLLAFKNQDYQFEELVESLNIKRDLKHNPLFDVMLVLHHTELEPVSAGKIKIENYPVLHHTSMFDLTLNIFQINNILSFAFEFNTDLFYNKTVRRLISYFINIIRTILANPGINIGRIKILSDAEEKQLLYEFNDYSMNYPGERTFHELFEEQAALKPHHTALIYNHNTLSYKTLNEQANQLAHYLAAHYPVAPEMIIGIMLERSIELIVSLLAVLKAGAAYLPLNAGFPDERILYMLKDSRCRLVITRTEFREKIGNGEHGEILLLDKISCHTGANCNLKKRASAHNLLYTIYTSGTTGEPRAVMVQHNHFINIAYGWRRIYKLDSMVVNLLQLTGFSFDVFAGDLGRALINGGTLVICTREEQLDFKTLYALILKYKITLFEATPSLIIPFIQYIRQNNLQLKQLKLLILGSDICSARDFMEIYNFVHPHTRLINSYGTTEATIDSTWFEGTINTDCMRQIAPIGKPFPNVRIYILDRNMALQPVNVPGELYIGGDSVSRGYLFNDRLNSERFTAHPFEKGGRLYKTGDIARWHEDGNIEFIGRADNQIKIRGYRINPVEIETMIRKHPGINDAIVIAREFFPGDLRLAAYLLTNLLVSWEDIDQHLGTSAAKKTCRRSELRVQYHAPCLLKLPNKMQYEVFITNLSYSGLSIKWENIPVFNKHITLSFTLPDKQQIEIGARVNYATPVMINFTFNNNFHKKKIIKHAIDRMADNQKIITFDLRRSGYRINFCQNCTLKTETQNTIQVASRDISFSGISLKPISPDYRIGDQLEISFFLPLTKKNIRITGMVIWKNSEGIGIKFAEKNNILIHQELANFIKYEKFTIQDLRSFLEKVLPEYMIPSIFVIIDEIPLTPHGKVNRLKLPEPNFGLLTGTDHEHPSTAIEKKIAHLWEDVLGLKEIGINDNFFLIGGNSIKALYAALKSGNLFSLSDLFKFPTIKQLAQKVASPVRKNTGN